jgi:heptosyltransferase-3
VNRSSKLRYLLLKALVMAELPSLMDATALCPSQACDQASIGPRSPERLACLIVARQLGDAAIVSGFLRALAARAYAREYVVWTRPQLRFLFENILDCEIVCSQFPVGTTKNFGGTAVFGLMRAAWRVRKLAPSVTLDLIGDFRERSFAALAGSRRHLHIGWHRHHPFARLVRNHFGPGRPLVVIPPEDVNVYTAYGRMLDALAPGQPQPHATQNAAGAYRKPRKRPLFVGVHPFASQRCKLWPSENWRDLIRELRRRGVSVVAFAAPAERSALEALLGEQRPHVSIFTESSALFADKIRELDLLVGLDSFAVHLAQLQGVRSVTITAGNPPDLWVPLDGVALASSGGCRHYPCFNVPRCEGSAAEYACVRSITVQDVLSALGPEFGTLERPTDCRSAGHAIR